METLPERPDPIPPFLSLFMSEEDVARYAELSYAIETVKKGQPCWQAPVSVGVHALMLGVLGETDQDKALAEGLVGHAMEPMEALHGSLRELADQQPLTEEQAHMLFHVRFGLGLLLLAKGDRARAMQLLRDMAATKLFPVVGNLRPGSSMVSYSGQLDRAKALVALAMLFVDLDVDEYGDALDLIREAAGSSEGGTGLVAFGCELLDRGAAKLEAEDPGLDAWVAWTDLLFSAADLLSVCGQVDTSGALPGDCKTDSAQFLAYKLGELAARFAVDNADVWEQFIADMLEEYSELTAGELLFHSLMCEYDRQRSWQEARHHYVDRWERAPHYAGVCPDEVGPHMDLYWAIRIGFADKVIESTHALEEAGASAPRSDFLRDIETVKEVVTTMAIRQLKEQRDREQRLAPTEHELTLFLKDRLGSVWDNLPSDATCALVSAEYGYRVGWQAAIPVRAVLKGFHEAVEACFESYFTRPFATCLNNGGVSRTTVYWGVWRGRPQRSEFHVDNPRCLSLGKWAGALEVVTDASLSAEKNPQVAAFLKHNWQDLGGDALRELAGLLSKVQGYRNRAEHPHSPPRPHHTESSELDEMRKLILDIDGDGSSSVIAHICRLLAPSKQS